MKLLPKKTKENIKFISFVIYSIFVTVLTFMYCFFVLFCPFNNDDIRYLHFAFIPLFFYFIKWFHELLLSFGEWLFYKNEESEKNV